MRRNAVLWFVAIAGPMAWVAHLLVSYALVPFACDTDRTAVLHVTTAVTGVLAVVATAVAARALARRAGSAVGVGGLDSEAGRGGPAEGTGEAVVLVVGLVLGAFFLLVVAMGGVASAVVGPCS